MRKRQYRLNRIRRAKQSYKRRPAWLTPANARTIVIAALIIISSLIPRGSVNILREFTNTIKVYDTSLQKIVNMPLEEYVQCVVAAEMPAPYNMEALKAQAVAARTRAIASRCARFSEANVCTDNSCCQAFASEEEQRAKWGVSYWVFRDKTSEACAETAGEIITFENEPILVLYHAISGGRTEDVELVFSEALSYLRGVESPGEENAAKYAERFEINIFDFVNKINDELEGAKLTPTGISNQIKILARSGSNRVTQIQLGGAVTDGRSFRRILGLNSTNFEIDIQGDIIRIDTLGYGHGVGMSQTGAQAMAEDGAKYDEIIKHYYTGVDIVKLRQ